MPVTRAVRETQGQPVTAVAVAVAVPCPYKVTLPVIPEVPEVPVTVAAVVLVVLVARVVRVIRVAVVVQAVLAPPGTQVPLQLQFPELSWEELEVTVETRAILVLAAAVVAAERSIACRTATRVVAVAEVPVEVPEAAGAFTILVMAAAVGVSAVAPVAPVVTVIAGLGLAAAAAAAVVVIRALPVAPAIPEVPATLQLSMP